MASKNKKRLTPSKVVPGKVELYRMVLDGIESGESIREVCKSIAQKYDIKWTSVRILYYRAKKNGFPEDGRFLLSPDKELSLALFVHKKIIDRSPLTDREIKALAFHHKPEASESSKSRWLARFKKRHRNLLHTSPSKKAICSARVRFDLRESS